MPVGGGGLIAGIAAYVKAIQPSVKIIGVEPTGAGPLLLTLVSYRNAGFLLASDLGCVSVASGISVLAC